MELNHKAYPPRSKSCLPSTETYRLFKQKGLRLSPATQKRFSKDAASKSIINRSQLSVIEPI